MSVPARRALCLVAALACAAAVSATIAPAAHAIEFGWSVEGAWYVQDGLIKVLAQEAVDPSSVDPDRISLRISDGGQSTQVPLDGVVAVRDDTEERVVLVYLPPDTWEAVSSSKQAFLTLEYGAFMHIPDGSAVLKSTVRVAMPDQHITVLLVRLAGDPHTDRLYLNFVDAVNVSRADWDGIYLREFHGGASGQVFRPFLGLDPMVAEGDGRTFVFALDARGREILLGTGRLILYTGNDTVASWDHIAAPEKSVWVRAVRLASAEYAADENRLYLRFTDGVNPYSIHLSRMYFFDLIRFEEMRGFGFVGVSDDRRTIILDLSESARYDMSVLTSPWMVIKAGAVSTADGTDFGHHLARLKVTGAADFFPPDPDIPAGLLVGRSQVSVSKDAVELVLHFREPVNSSSIEASRISVVTDKCTGRILSDMELVGVHQDGRSAVFELGADSLVLETMGSAWVRLEEGVVATAANGTSNDSGDVPLIGGLSLNVRALPGSALVHLPCHLTYAVGSPERILGPLGYDQAFIVEHTETVLLPAIRDALSEWSELNPHITFEMVAEGVPDIEMKLLDIDDYRAGLVHGGYGSPLYAGGGIRVAILQLNYDLDILGLREYDQLRRTISHEFGHNLGLLHHPDVCHLMYGGNDEHVQDPFDDLGYNIPDPYNWLGRPQHCRPG